MDFQRSHRVADLIQQEVSTLLLRGLKDPRVGFVTVTAVEASSDLRHAKIFITVMGDEAARKESLRGLTSAIPFIRRELGKRLRLRLVPELVFHYDTSLEYGNRIEAMIRDLHSGEDDAPGDTEDN